MDTAKAYAMELANTLTPIHMLEFFKDIQAMCYADQDISFMEYFIDLIHHQDEFIVPYDKLSDHNIIIGQEMDIQDQLRLIDLEYEVDFILVHEAYMLTPNAYKKCL